MSFMSRLLGFSTVSVAICAFVYASDAATATGRAGYTNVINTSFGTAPTANNASTLSRMPSMPAVSINTSGNLSAGVPLPVSPIQPKPTPKPDIPDTPITPDTPDTPKPDKPACVYDYTVEQCMNDISACINNGALPNGLNDMFDENIRNSITNGMGLCITQVENCVARVGIDCKKLYNSNAEVWIDFNSRRVQPEYYNFVLRKTGLTPNQAENTCLLLDRNTYGASFNAVDNSGNTTAEFNKQINRFNNNYAYDKANPLGAEIDAVGIDSERGHYARWDATSATCLVRVAAYNKDTQITDNLLFGAVGDGKPAEVWKSTGDTFKCDKDLFGFSLMKQSETAAIIALPGGTVLGTAIGAGVGVSKANKNDDRCSDKKFRDEMWTKIKNGNYITDLNNMLCQVYKDEDDGGNKIDCKKDNYFTSASTSADLTTERCNKILKLKDIYNQYSGVIANCSKYSTDETIVAIVKQCKTCTNKNTNGCAKCYSNDQTPQKKDLKIVEVEAISKEFAQNCKVKPLTNAASIMCAPGAAGCKAYDEVQDDVDSLGRILAALGLNEEQESRSKTIAKSTGIGAAIGAGTGGLATAITALVESGNINCRVGDDLARVSFNKSYSIETLKDYYVKWNLRLPDSVIPTANAATDYASWQSGCAMFTNMSQCDKAQIYYKPAGASLSQIPSACKWANGTCGVNEIIAVSRGARDAVHDCDTWTDTCAKLTSDKCEEHVIYYQNAYNTIIRVENACQKQNNECQINKSVAQSYGACKK